MTCGLEVQRKHWTGFRLPFDWLFFGPLPHAGLSYESRRGRALGATLGATHHRG